MARRPATTGAWEKLVPGSTATLGVFGTVSGRTRRFFFSSRRRHTRSDRDWGSDVCSSDLIDNVTEMFNTEHRMTGEGFLAPYAHVMVSLRSEERRVGKECRSRWSPYH